MKSLIIFHTVTGCCYDLAHMIKEEFENLGIASDICCIRSFNQKEFAKKFDYAKEYYQKILDTPQVDIDSIPYYDLLVMVSPTYFGNVSSEIKYVMDSMEKFWFNRSVKHMKFLSVTSCSTAFGGGSMTLQSMNTFAQHMGMKICAINDFSMPAYGLVHVAGETSAIRPRDNKTIIPALRTIVGDIKNI